MLKSLKITVFTCLLVLLCASFALAYVQYTESEVNAMIADDCARLAAYGVDGNWVQQLFNTRSYGSTHAFNGDFIEINKNLLPNQFAKVAITHANTTATLAYYKDLAPSSIGVYMRSEETGQEIHETNMIKMPNLHEFDIITFGMYLDGLYVEYHIFASLVYKQQYLLGPAVGPVF